jgi:hypothetical protein
LAGLAAGRPANPFILPAMTSLRTALAFVVLAFAAVALAAPSGQSRACAAKNRCDSGLACVAHSGGKSTCQIVCASRTKCPENQRCVRDGAQSVCRPVVDL